MPFGILSTPSLFLFIICGLPTTAIIASNANTPNTMDALACVGAMLASALAAADACRKDKSFPNMLSVVLSSAFVGSVGPGAAGYYFIPDKMLILTWHAWAAAGLIFGLGGFGLVHSITALWNNYHAKIEKGNIIPGFFDDDTDRGGPPKKP